MKRHFGSDCCGSKTKRKDGFFICQKCKKYCVTVRLSTPAIGKKDLQKVKKYDTIM